MSIRKGYLAAASSISDQLSGLSLPCSSRRAWKDRERWLSGDMGRRTSLPYFGSTREQPGTTAVHVLTMGARNGYDEPRVTT